ncbi:MAG TPA: DUF4159 domain-containing protein [Chthonomonadales bacterium]|nr:DUF4159 domain-containing protein [Chthonomonadales bacterium]
MYRIKAAHVFLCLGLLVLTALVASGTGPTEKVSGNRVQCANLVYAVNKTSVCFSDRFLKRLEMETKILTEPRFTRVHLDNARQLCNYPFAIMTGEGGFTLTEKERINLRHYLTHGGFLVASAGCSDPEWTRSFRREFARIFPGKQLKKIPMSHPLFRTVYLIRSLETSKQRHAPQAAALEGYSCDGKLVLVLSPDGLNDTAHAQNCCCCGGDEISNAEFVNVNLLAYALLH